MKVALNQFFPEQNAA